MTSTATPIPSSAPKTASQLQIEGAFLWAFRRAAAVREACAGYPLVVFLLGSRYLDAVEPPLAAGGAQRFVFLARPAETTRLVGSGVIIVPAGAREATAYREGLVALKGKMFRLFALGLARSDGALLEDVLRDDTPASFVRAMRLGLEVSPQ